MKSKLLFTAALMSAASLASQETNEAKGIVTDKSAIMKPIRKSSIRIPNFCRENIPWSCGRNARIWVTIH